MNSFRRTKLGVLAIMMCLALVGCGDQYEAIGQEFYPGVEVPKEEREGLENFYEQLAHERGLSFDDARSQGLTLSDLQGIEHNPDHVIRPDQNLTGSSSSSRSGTSRSERMLIRMVGFTIFGAVLWAFRQTKDFYTGSNETRDASRQL